MTMDIVKEQQIEAMRSVLYFLFNWNPDFIKEAFPNQYNHLNKKFVEECDCNVSRFFVELDSDNQFRMLRYVLEHFKG